MVTPAFEIYDNWNTVYKYRGFNRDTLSILIDQELYYASPSQLNDPHDCQIDIAAALDEALIKIKSYKLPSNKKKWASDVIEELRQGNTAAKKIKRLVADNAICSFSLVPDHVLMWSHYAEAHRGFCLGFDPKLIEEHVGGGFDNIYPKPVTYLQDNPFISVLEWFFTTTFYSIPRKKYPSLPAFFEMAAQSVLSTKSLAWSYEQEVRFIRRNGGKGAVKFPSEALVEVVFGYNMSNRDRKTLSNILKAPEWKKVQLREVKKLPTSYAFNIVDV